MISASGRHVIVFNGEIYNFEDLRPSLPHAGRSDRGHSDTEVLLESIEAWGLDATLEKIDGMFAFAVWDRRDQTLSLARDRFGEKPLYTFDHAGHLWFASEVSCLDEVSGARTLDEDAVADYFSFGYVGGDRTIYSGVRPVAPGTYQTFEVGRAAGPKTVTYWSPLSTGSGPRRAIVESEAIAEAGRLLSQSIKRRLVADRPVGAFLSGGIDSSITCALAAEQVSSPLKTFTMCWEQSEYDESKQAAAVASSLGACHHEVRLGASDVIDASRRLGGIVDQPFADQSQLGVMLLAEEARRSVVVALSGDGGDELFAGYNRHRWLLRTTQLQHGMGDRQRRAAAWGLRRVAPAAERVLRPFPESRRPRLLSQKITKLTDALTATSGVGSYQRTLTHLAQSGRTTDLPPEVALALNDTDRDHQLWGLRVADLIGFLPDCVLTKVDRATMSVALESRTPFLTKDLAQFALSLPADALIHKGRGKLPLRGLLKQMVQGVDFSTPKTGFSVPVADLMRGGLRSDVHEAVASHTQREVGIGAAAPAALKSVLAGEDEASGLLWATLMFEQWASRHLH